ncbi:DUF4376 domain-containing protein [Priestia megaterium]|uniref:DUF4376 domain-containing protein n=1 Tax=Priestia megaterium TaxID=1404 RepID=UPI000BFC241B|nr:hypothetical protein [Priestia megaterium]PGQ88276.1 hypothetical protein COA18_04935 [Priestia megaterium]
MALKEYYEIDTSTGKWIDIHVLDPEEDEIPDNYVLGWGGDKELFDPMYDFTTGQWVEARDAEYILNLAKQRKDAELNDAANRAIQAGFDHEINGVIYHFSFDTEAQLNYQGAERLLSKGTVTSIDFTVFRDNQYERIPIDAAEMEKLTLTIMMHKNRNIVKYRELLLPLVEEATTIQEVAKITWDSI